jgi:WD40 repeat protein
MRSGLALLAVAAFYVVVASIAHGEEQPILMLDTSGHRAEIRSITFTGDGKYLVSASDDKLVRVWDWQAGKTVRTIRGQMGVGDYGKVFAMALSPDQHWLAVAGWLTPGQIKDHGDIRLYDFATGQLQALLKGQHRSINMLAFSPDSRWLISGSFDPNAIIWDVRAHRQLHPPLKGHTANVFRVGFTSDGKRTVTASWDKTLRLWNVADGSLVKVMTGHSDQVRALAVSPSDGTIASADASGEIRLWDGKTGSALSTSPFAQLGSAIGTLSFSPDGRLLLATCYQEACGYVQRVFEVSSGKQLTEYKGHDDIVSAAAFSPEGRLVATAGGSSKEINVWDPRTGETKATLKGTGSTILAVAFSSDGRRLAWGSTNRYASHNDRGPLEVVLRLPSAGESLSGPESIPSQEGWIRAQTQFGTWSLRHRAGGIYGYDEAILDILQEGSARATITRDSSDGYRHRAYGFTPDGDAVISAGSNGFILAYQRDGSVIGNFVGHEYDVQAIAASPDGKYLASGSADQTVRLWNLKTRELIVSLFRGSDGEWVIWTPQGYYMGSPGADKIIGWQINRGPNKAPDYVTAEQLRKYLNRPDIVAKAIQLASAEEAVRGSHGTEFKLSDLLARPAPQLRIVSPAPDALVAAAGGFAVKIELSATPDPVTRIRIQVNGRQLDDFLPRVGPKFEPGEHEFSVPLAKGKNTIVVTALNEIGWSKVQDGTLTLTNESAGELDKRGTLYILAVGVTKYPGIADWCRPRKTCDLNYTGQDAVAFAEVAERQFGPLHNKTIRRVLVNGGSDADTPTAAHIIDALSILSDATANDTVAVFLAGHGFEDGPNYRFVSTDAADAGGKIRASSVVPWYAIEEAIDQAKGRRLLFVDTCHSAGAYNERLGNTAYYANILAYSSARWDQEALESAEYQHGLFTQALLEALNGEADTTHQGRVDTVQLNEYLQKRVPELAKALKYRQNPQFFKGRDAETYILALVQ